MENIVAFDLGTSALKTLLFSPETGEKGKHNRFTTTLQPAPGHREQDAREIFQHIREHIHIVADAFKEEKDGVVAVFSGAMHSWMAVDKQNVPLTHAMLWSDSRAAAVAARLRSTPEGMELYRRTGTPIHPMSPLCKLIWLKENQPDIFRNADAFMGIKEFVWSELTGKRQMDMCMASATGLMNLESMEWDEMALSVCGLEKERLPEIVSITHTLEVNTGGIPVHYIIGGSDGALANRGAGATEPAELALSLGTSGAVRRVSKEPWLDADMRTFCYRYDDRQFLVGGATNNGLNILYWIWKKMLGREWDEDAIYEAISEAPDGSDGLICLPYLLGERAPYWDGREQGVFFGLHDQHGPAHLLRAAQEGVLFHLRMIAEVLEKQGHYRRVVLAGGGPGQLTLVDLVAPIFNRGVELNTLEDASSLGALKLGAEARKLPMSKWKEGSFSTLPNSMHCMNYDMHYQRFKKVQVAARALF
jgi:gluconokinase